MKLKCVCVCVCFFFKEKCVLRDFWQKITKFTLQSIMKTIVLKGSRCMFFNAKLEKVERNSKPIWGSVAYRPQKPADFQKME